MRALFLCAALVLMPMAALAQEASRIMTVTGAGSVARAPDMVVITLGVEAQADTAQAAMAETSAAMTRLQERMTAEGIAARDIQTTQVSLNPVYEDRNGPQRRVVGFNAANTVTLRLREMDMAGPILGALVEDGANRIGRISFALQDNTAAMDEARSAAVADAQRKAQLLAGAAGVTLGAIRDIREVGSGGPDPMPMARMAADAGVPLAEGELTLNAAVTLVYEIE